MEAKFTPGPWEVDPKAEFNVRVVGAGRSICSTGGYTTNADHGEHVEENRRNARFIAAAPEMYEALEDLPLIALENDWPYEVENVRTALAKARGET